MRDYTISIGDRWSDTEGEWELAEHRDGEPLEFKVREIWRDDDDNETVHDEEWITRRDLKRSLEASDGRGSIRNIIVK
jgi:hypothetical protein